MADINGRGRLRGPSLRNQEGALAEISTSEANIGVQYIENIDYILNMPTETQT